MSVTTIENEYLRISIASFGAEMCSFFDRKRNLECLWQADPTYWARHAPVLFPIVGRLPNDELICEKERYPMTQHGFARDSEFEVKSKTETTIILSLMSNKNSLEKYPFNFELLVEYKLENNRLITSYTIRNPANKLLPASIGAHPAFNWPLLSNIDKTGHTIHFDHDEPENIRRLENGLMLEETFKNPIQNKKLVLDDSLFEKDALIFDQIRSKEISYSAANEMSIRLKFNDFQHLGIWTKPGAPFICLEPWQGYSSPVGFEDDFAKKPGLILVPGHSEVKKSFEIILDQ